MERKQNGEDTKVSVYYIPVWKILVNFLVSSNHQNHQILLPSFLDSIFLALFGQIENTEDNSLPNPPTPATE